MTQTVEKLNERAKPLGYGVEDSELVGFPLNMGGGAWCRITKDGEPCFSTSWRADEVEQWLGFRERDAA